MTGALNVNTNLVAMKSQSQLNRTNDKQNLSMERLSSGSKINSAKDDAAGLQISNRLQSQKRGLDVAIRNAHDGISMLQTAEGAMAEYSENLIHMRDLTLRHANGSLSIEDKDAIQKEYKELTDELYRIGQTTRFGDQPLLNGVNSQRTFQIGGLSGEGISIQFPKLIDTTTSKNIEVEKYSTMIGFRPKWRSLPGDKLTLTGDDASFWQPFNREIKNSPDITIEIEPNSSMADVADQINSEFGSSIGAYTKLASGYPEDQLQYLVVYTLDNEAGYVINNKIDGPSERGNSPFYSDNQKVYGGLKVTIEENISETHTIIPSLDKTATDSVIEQLDKILAFVDSERAKFGATQNRLAHAINNLSQTSENVADSNSQIKDADYAKETTELTKQSILKDVNVSMLAQAKSSPQSALSLLS